MRRKVILTTYLNKLSKNFDEILEWRGDRSKFQALIGCMTAIAGFGLKSPDTGMLDNCS